MAIETVRFPDDAYGRAELYGLASEDESAMPRHARPKLSIGFWLWFRT